MRESWESLDVHISHIQYLVMFPWCDFWSVGVASR